MLLFGLAAAPACWIAQVALARVATALVCTSTESAPGFIRGLALAGDAAALAGAFAGGVAGFLSWHRLQRSSRPRSGDTVAASRNMLLAMWAMMTSVWLFGAIAFNSMGSVPVLACAG